MQKGFAWLCAALLAFTVQAHAQSTAPAKVELDVMGELTIDAQGAVSGFSAAPSVPAPVAKIVQDAVKHWRFEPVLQDGKPAETKTQMFLFLTGEPGEGGYRLRVERVQFGFPRKMRDVKWARAGAEDALREHVGGEVLVAVHIDAAGNVLDAAALRSRLVPDVRNQRVARKLRTSFETSVVATMKQSKFEPADPSQGGAPTAMITNMSISFGQPNVATVWTQADTAITATGTPAWLSGSLADGTLDRVAEGQQIALDGGPKLQTAVVGKLL
jgi:hypothetical protein